MKLVKVIFLGTVLTSIACANTSNTTSNSKEHTDDTSHFHSDKAIHEHDDQAAHKHTDKTHRHTAVASAENNKGAYKVSKENCESKVETKKYSDLVGKNILVEMLWHDVHPSTKDIRFPFQVTGYTDEGLTVFPHQFPLQELYMALLFNSGHLLHQGKLTILDTCSSEITEQEKMSPYHY